MEQASHISFVLDMADKEAFSVDMCYIIEQQNRSDWKSIQI